MIQFNRIVECWSSPTNQNRASFLYKKEQQNVRIVIPQNSRMASRATQRASSYNGYRKRGVKARMAKVASRRATGRKRMYPMRSIAERVHTFQKCYTQGSITNATGAFSIEPTMGGLAGVTDITNLFDSYRIVAYEILFVPTQNFADIAAVNDKIPSMWICNDYDGGGPTTAALFYERPDAKLVRMDNVYKWRNRDPRVQDALWAGGAFAGYAQSVKGQWINCTSTGVPYYGTYCLMINNANMAAGATIDMTIKCTIQAKGIR